MKAMIKKSIFLLLLVCMPLQSQTFGIKSLDADECRTLMEAGKILSMTELMKLVSTLSEGKIIDTHLLQKAQTYIYEMEIAGKDGMITMLYVDARNGRVVEPTILYR